jgi:hypothetical protein
LAAGAEFLARLHAMVGIIGQCNVQTLHGGTIQQSLW